MISKLSKTASSEPNLVLSTISKEASSFAELNCSSNSVYICAKAVALSA
jgi:hypothetical protein